MEAHLRAGMAIFNAGDHHAAHDAWEDHWLDLEAGTDDERLLHGLIQFTAAVHHGYHDNWVGLGGLADSAGTYLSGLESEYRGVNVAEVRAYLRRLADDPEHLERAAAPPLRHAGEAVELDDLDFEAAAVAARVFAEGRDGVDAAVIDDGVAFARQAVSDGRSDRYVALVMDFATDEKHRWLAYERLAAHVQRRRRREHDVDELFDPSE